MSALSWRAFFLCRHCRSLALSLSLSHSDILIYTHSWIAQTHARAHAQLDHRKHTQNQRARAHKLRARFANDTQLKQFARLESARDRAVFTSASLRSCAENLDQSAHKLNGSRRRANARARAREGVIKDFISSLRHSIGSGDVSRRAVPIIKLAAPTWYSTKLEPQSAATIGSAGNFVWPASADLSGMPTCQCVRNVMIGLIFMWLEINMKCVSFGQIALCTSEHNQVYNWIQCMNIYLLNL